MQEVQTDQDTISTRNTEIIETKEDPKKWIKNHIMGGQDFNNDFRSKYFARLGLQRPPTSGSSLNNSYVQEKQQQQSQIKYEQQQQQQQQQQQKQNGDLNNSTQQQQQQQQQQENNQKSEKQLSQQFDKQCQLNGYTKSDIILKPYQKQQLEEQEKKRQIEEKENDKKLVVERTFSYDNIQLNFMTRTDEQVRQNYFNKLINNKILKLQPSKKQQTIIIFDWDDTILCTSYLGNLGFIDLPVEVNSQMMQLDISASKILQKSISYGDTFIITNAAQGWVEYSSKLYFPKVNQILKQQKISVISARSGYEELFPGDCHRWKVEAFKNIKKDYDANILANLICLGDSNIEMDAAHSLAKHFNQVLVKTIKFRENPKPEELVKQQDLVGDKFEQIYKNLRNLTIRLEKKATDKN